MSSGFDRQGLSLMRRLGAQLGVNDVKQAPARLKTDELIPVVGVDAGWANYEQWTAYDLSSPLVGRDSWTWEVVGNGSSNSPAMDETATYKNQGREVLILGMHITISYSVAGIILDDGEQASLVISRQAANSAISVLPESIFPSAFQFQNGVNRVNYYWSHPWYQQIHETVEPNPPYQLLAMQPVFVPAGSRYIISSGRSSSEVDWPADTFLSVNAFGVSCPAGFAPPGM